MTQAHTLSGFGYEATQEGLQRYRTDLQRLMASRAMSAPPSMIFTDAVFGESDYERSKRMVEILR